MQVLETAVTPIDGPALLAIVNDDQELVAQLFEMFLADAPERVASMYAAIAESDPVLLQAAAHCIKGAAANLRAMAVAELALRIEVAAQRHDFTGVDSALGELERALADVPAALQNLLVSIA